MMKKKEFKEIFMLKKNTYTRTENLYFKVKDSNLRNFHSFENFNFHFDYL